MAESPRSTCWPSVCDPRSSAQNWLQWSDTGRLAPWKIEMELQSDTTNPAQGFPLAVVRPQMTANPHVELLWRFALFIPTQFVDMRYLAINQGVPLQPGILAEFDDGWTSPQPPDWKVDNFEQFFPLQGPVPGAFDMCRQNWTLTIRSREQQFSGTAVYRLFPRPWDY